MALPPARPISSIISRDMEGKKKIFRMSSVSAREGHGDQSVRGMGNDRTGAQKLKCGQLLCHPASSQLHVIN